MIKCIHCVDWRRLGRASLRVTLCGTGCLLVMGGQFMQRGGVKLIGLGSRFAPEPRPETEPQ